MCEDWKKIKWEDEKKGNNWYFWVIKEIWRNVIINGLYCEF
jgi:hypothetical protein